MFPSNGESDVSVMFPSNGLITRRPASLPRVLGGASSPASTVLSGRYDFLPPIPPHFVAFARTVPREHASFAPTLAACVEAGPGVGHPVAPSGVASMETTGSPTFLGNPDCALALLSDPGGTDTPDLGDASARPPICPPRRLPHSYFRGSITRLRHWLSTLRRPGRPDTTQDSLPTAGQALPDGLDYPQGSIERFHDVSYIDPPFPSFRSARTPYIITSSGVCSDPVSGA